MTSDKEQLFVLASRLTTAEIQLRRLSYATIGLLGMLVAVVATHCGPSGKLTGSAMALHDSAGHTRIELSAEGSHPFLRFFDPSGSPYTSLEMDGQTAEPLLSFRGGRDHRIKGEFGVDAMGASVTTLFDGHLQSSVTALSVSPVIMFTGPVNGARVELGESTPRVTFVDEDGNVTGSLARER